MRTGSRRLFDQAQKVIPGGVNSPARAFEPVGGDPVFIAEVIRDLHRSSNQPDQSYSERQIYEAAMARLARELAAVEKIDEDAATERLEGVLAAA